MPMMGWGGNWLMGVGVIGFVLICFLIIMELRFTVWTPIDHRIGCGMGRMSASAEAEEILRQRYARGEVTKEQYDQILRDLQE